MMTSSKAQQCAKLPAWMFGLLGGAKDKLFGLGLGVNIYGAGRSNVKNFNNTKNLEKYRPKVVVSQTILVLWDYPDAGFLGAAT